MALRAPGRDVDQGQPGQLLWPVLLLHNHDLRVPCYQHNPLARFGMHFCQFLWIGWFLTWPSSTQWLRPPNVIVGEPVPDPSTFNIDTDTESISLGMPVNIRYVSIALFVLRKTVFLTSAQHQQPELLLCHHFVAGRAGHIPYQQHANWFRSPGQGRIEAARADELHFPRHRRLQCYVGP